MKNDKPFVIEDHTGADKSFLIMGPIDLAVDYDDVDHKRVDAIAKKIVRILNANWNPPKPVKDAEKPIMIRKPK